MGEASMATLSRIPFSWRAISALILGVLIANWFWIFFAPHATFTTAVPERSAGIEAEQLFGTVQSNESATQGIALPNVKLLGIFAANAGKPGFAILKLDERTQVGVVEGEEVAVGTKLVGVFSDYVLLERAGVQQQVNLENKYSDTPNKGIQPASTTDLRSNLNNEAIKKYIDKNIPNQAATKSGGMTRSIQSNNNQ